MKKSLCGMVLAAAFCCLQSCWTEDLTVRPEADQNLAQDLPQHSLSNPYLQSQIIIRFDEDYPDATKDILRTKYQAEFNFEIGKIIYAQWDDKLELWIIDDSESQNDIDINGLITSMKTADMDEGDLEEGENSIYALPANGGFKPSTNSDMQNHLISNSGPQIAIIDSGLDYGEVAGNYLRDTDPGDGSEVSGWDFVNADNNIRDDFGHGTHLTKVILSEMQNSNVPTQIIPLKAFDDNGKANLFNILEALAYVNANDDIDILNTSFGWNGPETSNPILSKIIDEIAENTLIVCSAGNDGINTDDPKNIHFPSGISNEHILAVAGYSLLENQTEQVSGSAVTNIFLSPFSNFGRLRNDIVAPFDGYVVNYSYYTGKSLEGTSYSAAFISARAAIAFNPNTSITLWRKNLILSGYKTSIREIQYRRAIIR